MSEALINQQTGLPVEQSLEIRNRILEFEQRLAEVPGAHFGNNPACPLTHEFVGGLYIRTIRIPARQLLTGKIHRHAHPNFLMQGEVLVVTEGKGSQQLKAPLSMISPANTKRVVYTLTDTVWITVHEVGQERDLKEIEKMVIAESYEQLEQEKHELAGFSTTGQNHSISVS